MLKWIARTELAELALLAVAAIGLMTSEPFAASPGTAPPARTYRA